MSAARTRAFTPFLIFSPFRLRYYVEMSVARTRAFTHDNISVVMPNGSVEMSVARTRAFTQLFRNVFRLKRTVEMSVARTRAFTPCRRNYVYECQDSRNECCPYEGIYTVRTFKLTTVSAG